MEQAGINHVQLIEIKNITSRYDDDGTNILLESDGAIIDIDNDFSINFKVEESRNRNGKTGYYYELDFTELSAENIQTIRRSIYGFYAVFTLNDLDSKILLLPLLYNNANQDNNISASYSTKISNFVKSQLQLVPFDDTGLEWILSTGYWNDDAFWIDSRIWID